MRLDFLLNNGKRAIPGYVLKTEKNWVVYDNNIQKGFDLIDLDNNKQLGVVALVTIEGSKTHITVTDNVSKGKSKQVLYTVDENDESTWHYGSVIGHLPLKSMAEETSDKSLVAVVIKGYRSMKKKDFDKSEEFEEHKKKGGKIVDYSPIRMGAYIECYPYTYRVFEVKEVIDLLCRVNPDVNRDTALATFLMP